MSKARRWVIIVLSLAVLVMIGINMAEKDDTAQVVVNNNDPTYKSEHTDTLVRTNRLIGLFEDKYKQKIIYV